ncbi:MAG: pilus assembly protein PilP [Gammaproteobacteria bacterium]|nr:pilus assembly protein PilP [Gammaproteobacteria bacterium]
MRRVIVGIPAGVLAGLLATGCDDDGHADIQAFTGETARESRPVPVADTHTPAPSREPFAYAAGGLRSPFEPPPALESLAVNGRPRVAPDLDRAKAHLERFPLDQLRLAGNLSSRGTRLALVRDPNGTVHPVGVGEHMGTDFGRIRAVTDTGVELVEVVRDAEGWIERPRFISLAGGQRNEGTEQTQ